MRFARRSWQKRALQRGKQALAAAWRAWWRRHRDGMAVNMGQAIIVKNRRTCEGAGVISRIWGDDVDGQRSVVT